MGYGIWGPAVWAAEDVFGKVSAGEIYGEHVVPGGINAFSTDGLFARVGMSCIPVLYMHLRTWLPLLVVPGQHMHVRSWVVRSALKPRRGSAVRCCMLSYESLNGLARNIICWYVQSVDIAVYDQGLENENSRTYPSFLPSSPCS